MRQPSSKRLQLATRSIRGIWWSPAFNRAGDPTGIAHAIHSGVALCGARPFSMGASHEFAIQAGCRECQRCRNIINDADSLLKAGDKYVQGTHDQL